MTHKKTGAIACPLCKIQEVSKSPIHKGEGAIPDRWLELALRWSEVMVDLHVLLKAEIAAQQQKVRNPAG